MPDVLPEHARVEHAPAKVSPVTKVEKLGVISDHVHLLIGEAFVGSVLQSRLEDEQVARALCRQRHRVIRVLGVSGSHHVAAAVAVIVGIGPRSAIAKAEILGGDRVRERCSIALAIAAKEGGKAAFRVHAFAGPGEDRRRRVDGNRTANAVAAHADRVMPAITFTSATSEGSM